MIRSLSLLLFITGLHAQDTIPDTPVNPNTTSTTVVESAALPESLPDMPVAPVTPEESNPATTTPDKPALNPASDPAKLFQKGFTLGRVGDKPTGGYRRLVQRTIMIGEEQQAHRCILTFDDQILPTDSGHSSALDIAKDLQPRGVRAIFFANVPAVSEKSLDLIRKATSDREKQNQRVSDLLESKREHFISGMRELLKIKHNDTYICEIFNHTAFHQNMTRFKKGSAEMEQAIIGIRFIAECIDAAYAAERPEQTRMRYFRFPFLAEPRDKEARTALNEVFTELGLISLGETSDSKDYNNGSSTHAYKSLAAAYKGKRYGVKQGAYGKADEPIALFHTKTWSKIRKGVLKFLDEHPSK